MFSTKIKSYAKINVALNIINKTSSLHKIESIIVFVSLYDDILMKQIESKNHIISFYGQFSSNISKNNTISKLFNILDQKKLLKNKKFKIKINKRIPNKAGLGGGSMNAASILKHFIKKKIIKVSRRDTIEICNLIGSDVIIGLNSTNSILTSKNEIKSFRNCKKFYTLIIKPEFGCSTKYVYSKVKKFNKIRFNKPSKKMFNLNFLKKTNNQLEPIVLESFPKLKSIKYNLENLLKPEFVRITGSGSALVAYFSSKKRCLDAKKKFNKKHKNYWCIASKTI